MWKDAYGLELKAIKIDHQEVQNNFNKHKLNNSILDTGTTYVYFEKHLFDAMSKIFNDFCRKEKKNCFSSNTFESCYSLDETDDENEFYKGFPSIEFVFDGYDYKWESKNYFHL